MTDQTKVILVGTHVAMLVLGVVLSLVVFRDEVEVVGWLSAGSGGWNQYAPTRIEYDGVVYDCIARSEPILWSFHRPDFRDATLEYMAEQNSVYSHRLFTLQRLMDDHQKVIDEIARRRERYRKMLGYDEPKETEAE